MRTFLRKNLINTIKKACLLGLMAGAVPAYGQYASSDVVQNTASCFPGMNNAMVLEIRVVTSGSASVLNAMQFNTNGTTTLSNLESAKLYYANGGSFDTPLQTGQQVGSTVNNPNGSFSFTGLNQSLVSGTNLFYLVYDLPYSAVTSDEIDAECTGITVDNSAETPSTTAPTGTRTIVDNASYAYCSYTANNPLNYQIGISRLEIGDQVVTNVIATAGNVQTIASPVFNLVKDVTYGLAYKGGSGNNQNERVFVDLNNDGFFEVSEVIFTGVTPASSETTGSLYMDCGLESGLHRVRFSTELNGLTPPPCGPNNYGTAFEVLVNFIDAPAPTASFEAPTQAYRGAYVNYNNTSDGLGYQYRWDYDNDGNTDATTVNGVVQYSTTGNKTVQLAMERSSCGTYLHDSTNRTLSIVDPTAVPSSEFIANRNVTNQTLEVKFTDLSTNGANKWHWKITPENVNGSLAYVYVNGTDSTSQNPELLFLELGTYNVEFYSENVLGAGNYVVKPGYIRNIGINDFCSVANTTEESGFIADEGGVFASYPNWGTTGKLCGFLIKPGCAASISFNFLDFDMSSYQVTGCFIPGSNPQVLQPSDHVKIYDGEDNTGIPLHVAAGFPNGFTNGPNNAPLASLPPTVTAQSGAMYIEYSVNCAFNGRGFLGEWSSTPKTLPTPTASFTGPDTVYTDAPYIFTNTSTGDFDESTWDFNNDGLNDFSGNDADITFDNAGTQTVKLSVARCGNGSDFTKDVTVLAPTSAPNVEFEASRTAAIVLDTLRLFDRSDNGPNAWRWTITPASDISYVNGSGPTSRNPYVKFNKTGQYEVKLWASNALGQDSLVKSNYIGVYSYCIPNVVNLSNDIGISSFTFAGIDNQSTIGTQGYAQYSAMANVQLGASYPVEIQRTSNFNNANYKVWIDFNKNGSFNDPGEEVFVEPSNGGLSVSGTIRIPKGVATGITRMRVGANSESNPNYSCGPNQFGEFEDYSISISADDTKPVITLIGSSIFKMEQGYTYTDLGATAFDNADGDISSLITTNTNLNTSMLGEYWISYNVSDSAGNIADSVVRYIVVEPDGSGPDITLVAGDTVIHDVKTTWSEPGYSAIDFVDGVINTVTITGSVDDNQIGTYYLTYTAQDLQGNSNSVQRVVMVKDRVAPQLGLNGNVNLTVDFGSNFVDPGVSVSDNYYTGLTYAISGVVNTNSIGTTLITYTAKDPSGNLANSITRTVEVKDLSAPRITLTGSDTIYLDVFTKYIEPGYSVTDNHTKGLQVQVSGTVNSNVLGAYTITYTATDSSGNVGTASRVVIMRDREAPTIVLKGSSLINMPRFAAVPDPGVILSDNYDSEAELMANLTILNGVITDQEGLYQYCYQVEDNSGNVSAQVCRLVQVGPADPNGLSNAGEQVVRVYPNPTHGNIKIELPDGAKADHVRIYNANGALVKEVNVDLLQSEITLTQYTPGIYYVVVSVNGQLYSSKVSYIK